jgi:hypothetical protein
MTQLTDVAGTPTRVKARISLPLDVGTSLASADYDGPGLASLGGGESRDSQHTGTKALMLAVLNDGMQCFLSPTGRFRTEAEHWVMSRQRRSPFSFIVVCETLGLEPEAVRRALQHWRATNSAPMHSLSRRRPYVRRGRRLTQGRRGNSGS